MRSESIDAEVRRARRRFLARCGKFAAATPPAITLLLAASHANYAVASSGGFSGGSGGSGGNAPPLGDPPADPPITNALTNTADPNNQVNTSGGGAAGATCSNTFDALWNNDKCFR